MTSTAADPGSPQRAVLASPYSVWRSASAGEQLLPAADQARFVELLSRVGCHVYSGELLPAGGYVETYTGPGSEQFLGYVPDDDVDPTEAWLRAVHQDDHDVYLSMAELDFGRGVMALEYRMVGADGVVRWVLDQMWQRDELPDGRRLIDGVVTDITGRKVAELELVKLAHSDSLTGLSNRLDLAERVQRAARRLRRRASDRPVPAAIDSGLIGLALLLLDLDGFKAVNDSFGHSVGDELLVAVARRLSACVRPGDVAARLGGDEFAVLVDAVTPEEATAVADRVLDAMAAPFALGDRLLTLSASIGLVHTAELGDEQDLLRDADVAMYRAKADGKNRITRFEPAMQELVARRGQLAAEIRRGLADDEFVLHYQPLVDMATGEPIGLEALVRWQHRDRGLLPPSEFVAFAEQTGLIVPLGRWVLMQACADAARLQPPNGRLEVSVNISPRQLYDSDLIADVREALRASGLSPAALTVEITENLLLQDSETAAARLAELRALGVRVALDDFGTGYSSLAYLDRYPVDILKIDRSFVDPLDHSPRSAALVRSMVDLAAALEIEVIAEGVESQAHVAALTELGCRYAQGFFFARPQPLT